MWQSLSQGGLWSRLAGIGQVGLRRGSQDRLDVYTPQTDLETSLRTVSFLALCATPASSPKTHLDRLEIEKLETLHTLK